MATKTVVTLVDDLDGTPLEDGAGSTVQFSLEGKAYEIDLSAANVQALRDAIRPYAEAARALRATRTAAPARSANREVSAVREWAKSNGFTVSERGRISAQIQEAYDAAH